jgi:hypothetical protein
MLADLFAVHADRRAIIGGAEIREHPRVLAHFVGERFLVPDRSFVEHQIFALRVPIARNVQRSRGIEVVFDEIARVLGLRVLAHRAARARSQRIDDGIPGSIEADACAAPDVGDHIRRCAGGKAGNPERANRRYREFQGGAHCFLHEQPHVRILEIEATPGGEAHRQNIQIRIGFGKMNCKPSIARHPTIGASKPARKLAACVETNPTSHGMIAPPHDASANRIFPVRLARVP